MIDIRRWTTQARLALLIVAAIAFGVAWLSGSATAHADGGGTVYTLSNAAEGNAVLVFDTAVDGSVTAIHSVPTGGLGTGEGLGSQGAVTLSEDGKWLFAVNAGSNTVSSFEVTPGGLSLVGAFGSGGERPISVAVDDSGLLYVLNAGGSGGIAGFRVHTDGSLAPIEGSIRPLGAANSSPEQVGFSPNGHFLVVTLKDANAIATYVVAPNGTTEGPIVFDSPVPTPYAFGFDDAGRLLVANAASSSVASYNIRPNGTLDFISLVGDAQKAACWLVVTRDGDHLYTANAGSGNISGYTIDVEGNLALIDSGMGMGVTGVTGGKPLDLALGSDDQVLYALNADLQAINILRVTPDGGLVNIGQIDGLPAGAVGLAAQ